MPKWLRILIALVVLGVWLATAIASLAQGELPDYRFLGLPAGTVIALWPPRRRSRRRDDDE